MLPKTVIDENVCKIVNLVSGDLVALDGEWWTQFSCTFPWFLDSVSVLLGLSSSRAARNAQATKFTGAFTQVCILVCLHPCKFSLAMAM